MAAELEKHVAFWRALAEKVGRGVPVVKSLVQAGSALAGTEFEPAASSLVDAVGAGADLSEAMRARGALFPRSVRAMVRAGEASGMLDVVLGRIAEGVGDGSLPVPGAAAPVPAGRDAATVATARTFGELGRLLSAGVPTAEALEIVSEDAPAPALGDAWRAARRALVNGESLAGEMRKHRDVFTGDVVERVARGEMGGCLEEAVTGIAHGLGGGGMEAALPGPGELELAMEDDEDDLAISVAATDAEPVIKLVNAIVLEGIKSGATDVHIEPYAKSVKVRYRIDGVCVERLSPPKRLHNNVVTRIKIMACLDIAQRRIPQDGKFRLRLGAGEIDFRVAVVPTVYGETVVMRILRPDAAVKPLAEIVTAGDDLAKVRALCGLRSGLVLVTGVPGSGKSTLLYSMVHEIDREARSVVSVEDPVEHPMDDVQQIPVNYKAGLTPALALRSTLRLDADVVVLGEIRDAETADVAVKAATAGRLVLAAMHTPTPVETVLCLVDMAVPAYELNAALAGVVSQRLVRKLCPKCRAEAEAPIEPLGPEAAGIVRSLDDATFFSPVGCEECTGGYRGRAAIQEVLVPDDGFRRALSSGADAAGLGRAALAAGMTPFLKRGLELAAGGVTSVEEALRASSSRR